MMEKDSEAIQKLIDKHYRPVIEKRISVLELVKGKEKLYEKNAFRIESSLKRKLENHREAIEKLERETEAKVEQLEEAFAKKKEGLSEKKEAAEKHNKKRLKELDDTLDKRCSLNDLKRQKVEANHDYAVKEATKRLLEKQKKADESIDDAVDDHNDRMGELLKDTNIKHVVNENNLEIARTAFDLAHKRIETEDRERQEEILQKRNRHLAGFKDEIIQLEKAYEKARKPHEKAIVDLEKKQEKEHSALLEKQNKELAKQENYRKEAKKLEDSHESSAIDKRIKDLKKSHKKALEAQRTEHGAQMAKSRRKLQDVIDTYAERFTKMKREHVEAIAKSLADEKEAETEKLLELEKENTVFNKAFATFKKQKQNIRIDHDIQNININRTLKEIRLLHEHEKEIARPQNDLEENEARFRKEAETNELEKALRVARAQNERDKKKEALAREKELKRLDSEIKRLQYERDHDRENAEIEKELAIYTKDHAHEVAILDHHLLHTKNHVALQHERGEAFFRRAETEIERRLETKTNDLENLRVSAESDHKDMVERIQEIHEKEKRIYEETYEELVQDHEAVLANLKKNHAENEKKHQEKIDDLDQKKDKKAIVQLKKEFEELKEKHASILSEKKETQKNRRAAHKRMLDLVEEKRDNSLEETETLLYHITDQINAAINEARAQAEKEIERLEETFKTNASRADVFKMLQEKRKEETVSAADDYQNTRVHRARSRQTKSENALFDLMKALEGEQRAFEKKNADKVQDTEEAYEKQLTETEREKIENYRRLRDNYEEEKKSLTLYMQKLKKRYEETLAKEKQKAKAEEEQFFAEKQRIESELEKTRERLDKDFEETQAKKHEDLANAKNTYAQNTSAIMDKVKEKPHELLSADIVTDIPAMVKGEKEVGFAE